jgi:pullulanase-type alpha-1,6-glucosidase
MVKGLAGQGLRVIMDVVYNHTTASGQNARSVLDRIVPGYYHRLNGDGAVETSTCCQNTATEHAMMEKLMVDSVVLWAKHYKVDGFRFDIMGHHMKRNLLAVRQALDALTQAHDGVDGRAIYLHGEGWNFGEVANNARGENAIQRNLAGTGIGTFNDRMRDGARGGGPFSGLQEQGFLTGLSDDPNGHNPGSEAEQRARLLLMQDWLKVGLSGNLAGYAFVDRTGSLVTGGDVDYNGQRAGYTADPQEVISYVEAHDDTTIFDTIQLKAAPGADLAARVRMQRLAMSLVGFGQGIPFFHAGVELLRSKSLDRNSYNSGDWFNRFDVTGETHNWGSGLPPARDNEANWPVMAPLLADPTLEPGRNEIRDALAHFREVLEIRRSSRLFRLRTAAEVTDHLRFLNPGPDPLPGVLGLVLGDDAGTIDRRYRRIAVVFNANVADASLVEASLAGEALQLHPVQAASTDPVVRTATFDAGAGSFTVPGRTAAVFVSWRAAADRLTLLQGDVTALVQRGALTPGLGRALRATLGAAQLLLARGHRLPAALVLDAFVLEIRLLTRHGRLADSDGRGLGEEARDIAALLRAGL